MELTKQERRLSKLLLLFSIVFAIALLANIVLPLALPAAREFLKSHLPFVVNSAAKMGALFLLSFNAFINVRRNVELTKLLFWIHLLSVVILICFAVLAEAEPPMRTILIGGIVMDGVFGAIILIFSISAMRSRGFSASSDLSRVKRVVTDLRDFVSLRDGRFILSDIQRDSFAMLIDAVMPPPDKRQAQPRKLVRRFEAFIDAVDSAPRELIQTAFDIMAPVLAFANLTAGANAREHIRSEIQKMLQSEDTGRRNAARLLHIMITYLYYSDYDVDDQVSYKRFQARSVSEAATRIGGSRINVSTRPRDRQYDVCIVGSGVAGSLIANRLAKKGKSVLVLEAGNYYPEGEVTDDEFMMLAHLYKADVFQSALGNSFPVIQAQCVGGGGVVNNAVCFRIPDWVEKEWAGLGAGLNGAELKAAFDRLGNELKIRPADEAAKYLNPARDFFLRGVKSLGIPYGTGDPNDFKEGFYTVPVNIEECIGCGYCNLGCAYERKNNSLAKLLPEAIATGNCDIVCQAKVDSVATSLNGALKVDSLRVKLGNNDYTNVKAKKYILCAGAIASSAVLLKSGKIRLSGLPIGTKFSANAGTTLHAKFDEEVNAYAGLQISDYFLEKNDDGSWDWIAETWYNPPGTQSQGIPGYLDLHFQRMLDYHKLAAIGMLVGTEPEGRIVLNLLGQPEVQLRLPDSDIQKMKHALKRCSEVYLEAGAQEIQLITRNEMILKSKSELSRIDNEIRAHEDFLVLSTGHPMGGNPMSEDRTMGVVGTDFRVHGVDDLFVCDASVFPTSVKVNPQWTVMALADLCSQRVLEEI